MKKKHIIKNIDIQGPYAMVTMANNEVFRMAIEESQYVRVKHTKANGDTADFLTRGTRIKKDGATLIRVDGSKTDIPLEDGETLDIALQADARFR